MNKKVEISSIFPKPVYPKTEEERTALAEKIENLALEIMDLAFKNNKHSPVRTMPHQIDTTQQDRLSLKVQLSRFDRMTDKNYKNTISDLIHFFENGGLSENFEITQEKGCPTAYLNVPLNDDTLSRLYSSRSMAENTVFRKKRVIKNDGFSCASAFISFHKG